MNDRTHFSYRIDRWDDAGEYPVEHLASVEDSEVAEATYWAAHQRWPAAKLTLRNGAKVIERNWR